MAGKQQDEQSARYYGAVSGTKESVARRLRAALATAQTGEKGVE